MEMRKSKFDTSHTCIFVTDEDEKYADLKPAFKKHGLAFKNDRFIFFDETELRNQGYFDKDYITFIEAHEIAHTVLKHRQTSRHVEAEADFLAVLLCKDGNYTKSVKIGIREFKDRNGIAFGMFSKKYKDSVLKKVKK
jgi:hypothetical protein